LVAGGIAVEAFTSGLFTPEVRKTVAVLLLLLGMATGGGSFFRWVNVERAMRHQASLPVPVIAPILAAGGALVSAVLVVFVIWRPA
jgi:putative membrane protein